MKKVSKKSSTALIIAGGLLLGMWFIFSLQGFAATATSSQKFLSNQALVKMAGKKFADGNVPLGDNKYVKDAPKKWYVYLCNPHVGTDGGAQANGPWIDTKKNIWNFLKKISISGSVKWAQAKFSNTTADKTRTLVGNDLPIDHTTGTFPVAKTDAAYTYDSNPNTIKAQTEKKYELPLSPTYSETPYCMSGGEVGIMNSGVMLFNAFDDSLRDAPAHELQDSCGGHPQDKGIYHYHNMSPCFKDTSVSTVVGFAFDGFPITGPQVTKDTYLTTDDLDECHGITSIIVLDGKKVNMYHYVLTKDFPYSVSCFRGKPIQYAPSGSQTGTSQISGQTGQNSNLPQDGTPPPEAVTACTNKTENVACSFVTPDTKTISGQCHTIPTGVMACGPKR